MNRPRKRTELLLAAAALLLAAGVLLAAGARSALASQGPDEPPGTAQRANPFDSQAGDAGQNPFEAPQPGTDMAGAEGNPAESMYAPPGSYVVGYTGIVVHQPGEAPLQPYDGEGDPPPVYQTQPPVTAPPQPVQQQPTYPVNLNTATQAQLETLPGIGPVKAQAILAWRAANGGFTNANQLLQVSGIGQKTLDGLAPYVTW
ncbi:MAG: helix-hairpin-helix domain-containing protein [Oscillospiraceae bacterium]|nr:helix-hairpin-helix domain-containing protein [Oscillospiraceae bacterium]